MRTDEDGVIGLLGEPNRRAIFEFLARRPSPVGEIAAQLPISRPAVSQHLKVLRDGGLVVSRPEAREPLERVLSTCRIGGDWQVDPVPAHAGEFEVRFHGDVPEQTTIEVEHRHVERLVGGDGIHGAIEHGGGRRVALLAACSQLMASETEQSRS